VPPLLQPEESEDWSLVVDNDGISAPTVALRDYSQIEEQAQGAMLAARGRRPLWVPFTPGAI